MPGVNWDLFINSRSGLFTYLFIFLEITAEEGAIDENSFEGFAFF